MIERLLPKNYGFFELFERHAKTALEAGELLFQVVLNIGDEKTRGLTRRVEELENECDTITHLTIDLLRRSFITPFDRDEIRHLISALDDIVDFLEAAAQRIILYEVTEVPLDIKKMCEVLTEAQQEVLKLTLCLRHLKERKGRDYEKHCREINRLENEGDRFHRDGIAALFARKTEPLTLIKLKEIYEMLESAIDRCEDVANVIEGIAIEHVS